MKHYLMKCGHVATAFDAGGGKPVCSICAPAVDGMTVDRVVEGETGGLEGRKAHCTWCGRVTNSRWNLPFFAHSTKSDTDSYYCGCGGLD